MTSNAYQVTADELRQFVEQIEAGEAEKRDAAERIKEIYAEVKARGYCQKSVREVVKLRKQDRDTRAEAEAILDIYKEALGM